MWRIAFAIGLSSACFFAFASTPDLPQCNSWIAACCYTSSNRETSYDINRVVVHKEQDAHSSSAASWFANCASSASAHYAIDKDNGQCYQCVLETNVAWHAGYWNTNANSVGIEHSGWVANNDTSTACYDKSALETKSCITYYAVPYSRAYIIGHNEVPGCGTPGGGGTGCHTDPGAYWNWSLYMTKCNPNPVTNKDYIIDNNSGGFAASANWATGSSAGDKYGADYRFRSTAALSDRASWSATVAGGSYTVSAWWTAGANRSATAPYVKPDGATVNVNQQANGGKWNSLGTCSLAAGARATYLSCWTTTGYVVVADAVKYYGP